MKAALFLLALSAAAAGPLSADAPRPPRLTDYSRLWTDSPFTAKPPPPDTAPIENPLEDYALGGISKLNEGYYAILINREKPNEKIVLSPDSESEFEIVEVQWSDGSWKDTTATVRHGNHTGMVSFEAELLQVKSQAPEQTQEAPQQVRPPTPNANRNRGGNNSDQRKRRPRVVVPKTNGG